MHAGLFQCAAHGTGKVRRIGARFACFLQNAPHNARKVLVSDPLDVWNIGTEGVANLLQSARGWVVAGNWPPELDTLEAFGAPNADGEGGPNQAHWDVHSANASQQAGGWATVNANEYNSYNTYGVLWTPQTLTFYYDGQAVARTPTPSDFAQKMYMIATVAVGGTWPGLATGENATMKIDYIRAFSNNSSIPAVALQTVSSPDGGGHSLYGATSASSASSTASLVIPVLSH
jgi:beta-glucanase (GH16 family)